MSCAAATASIAETLGYSCWFCKRAELAGADQSQGWPEAKVEEILDFPRTSTLILAAYEDDLDNPTPEFPEEGKELLKSVTLVKKTCYMDTKDKCPPYIIAVDHSAKDITLAVRGLNLHKLNEYFTLLDNRKGKQVEDVLDFSRTCLLVMAVEEEDLLNPSGRFPEEGLELLQRVKIVKRVGYRDVEGRFPPYMISIDHSKKDVTVAVRAMNWQKLDDFMTVLDNRKGGQKFNDGFVHNGMLRSAGYLLDEEMDNLNALMLEYKDYTLTLAGHSLGSGVVCLMTLILLQNLGELKGVTRNRIRCHCFAPARCVSLNIAVSSADVINSIILQDDFLPRMNYPLETIFGFWFCLPCVLQWACCVDFFLPPEKLIKDPRRLYPPGRLFHLLYTDGGKCNVVELDPEAKVNIPVDGRFEKLIISRTTHADHLLTTIYSKLGKLMQAMKSQEEDFLTAPKEQKIERIVSCQKAKMESLVQAMERAQTLHVPNAFDPSSARLEEEEMLKTEVLGPEISEGSTDESAPAPPTVDHGKSDRSVSFKWSKIIDDIIAAEGSKQAWSEPASQKRWSFVRRAVKEHKVTEQNEMTETQGTEAALDVKEESCDMERMPATGSS